MYSECDADPHRKVFAEQVKKLEDSMQARIFGGDHFPKNKTTLVFNCNSIDTVEKFVQNCVYNQKKFILNSNISELQMISN